MNYFTGNLLNRLSHLRSNPTFLSQSLTHPSTKLILFRDLKPLLSVTPSPQIGYITTQQLRTHGVQLLLGDEGVMKVFLGMKVDEDCGDEEVLVFDVSANRKDGSIRGVCYWALEIGNGNGSGYDEALKGKIAKLEEYIETSTPYRFQDLRPTNSLHLEKSESALLAQARSLLDWNLRHQYCPNCGRKLVSMEAGYKLACPPVSSDNSNTTPCISQQPNSSVQNFSYPRTDPVVITLIHNADRADPKILLGRQRRWPEKLYSCIAGFIEPGESVEEAAVRECLEETGRVVKDVRYHSSQPWPFPNSLMLGCMAECGSKIEGDARMMDDELESTKWFSLEEVETALEISKYIDPKSAGSSSIPDNVKASMKRSALLVPPSFAIAHQLMVSWVKEYKVGVNKL